MKQRWIRFLLLFLLIVLVNSYLLIYIDKKVLRINCFPYETAYENFRNEEVTENVINLFLYPDRKTEDHKPSVSSIKSFSEYLTMYFALDQTCTDTAILDQTISFVKEYQPEKFYDINHKIEAMWMDAVQFPVGEIANLPDATVTFSNSWKQERTYGGERLHEGCDIMPSVDESGIFPVYSVSDGTVEQIGWLKLGGYRIGIRSEHGAYFYYAHLSEYARKFEIGEKIQAGTLLGFMGDTGYGEEEGTTGMFPVHLHFGIYFSREGGEEFSVNPYPLLRYLKSKQY